MHPACAGQRMKSASGFFVAATFKSRVGRGSSFDKRSLKAAAASAGEWRVGSRTGILPVADFGNGLKMETGETPVLGFIG
jgi:hypothetical protein